MTERLYYTDSYLTEFEAHVVGHAEGGRRIYLDRTAFYPTSGGQPFDTGQLGGVGVVDVVDEGERVAHLLAGALAEPPAGQAVSGQVNWARRFDHMQQHTGQHLLSAVFTELFGWATPSVHFGRESSTLDLDTPGVTPDQVAAAELRANEVVAENRPVEVTFLDAGAAGGLRKPSARSGVLRIVTIRDLDRSACGGTHVHTTVEVGPILIRKVERVRKVARVEFLCGTRALRRARSEYELLTRLGAALSSAPGDLPALLEAQRDELKRAEATRRELETCLAAYRADALLATTPPDGQGLRRVVLRDESLSAEGARTLAQALGGHPRVLAAVAGGVPPAVVIAASADSGLDAGALLKAALGRVGGRGGGSARLAQGTVGTTEAMTELLEGMRRG